MVTLIDYPASMGLLSASGDLRMPFSDPVKYIILALSVFVLLLALGILAWQIYRYCRHSHTSYTPQGPVNSDLFYSDEFSATEESYSGAPTMKVGDVSTEACRLSRCLSPTLFSSSGSSHADGREGEKITSRKVDGSLRFSVYFDQLQSRLVVTVLQAEGLLEDSQTRCLQPFVWLRLMGAGSEDKEGFKDEEEEGTPPVLWTVLQEWRTRVVKGSCNPLFGDQFSCILQEEKDKLRHVNLRLEVRDFDRFSRHTVLGEVRVPLGQLNIAFPLELQKSLQIPQKDLVGEVLLTLKFLPTSQRLEVGLLKVRTVQTQITPHTALYARISVQCNQSKLRHQKTSAVARCMVTVFNEVLVFSLPEYPMEKCKVLLSVFETNTSKKSSKNLIGQLSVGREKGSEDKHWTMMMRSVRQPVAQWHGLLI